MGKYCRQHIGKTFNDGKLTVVDGGDKNLYVKVKCNTCAEDFSLFGEAVYEMQFNNLAFGKLPCGCAKNPRWSLPQYETKIKRKIENEELPIKFIEFGESVGKKNSLTPVKFLCKKHNVEYWVESINRFFNGLGNFGKVYSTDERIQQYNTDNSNYKIWDCGDRIRNGGVVCGFYCKICEDNNRECLFTMPFSELIEGRLPCYCSTSPKMVSGDYYIESARKQLYKENIEGVSVIGAVKGVKWRVVFLCDIHGVYSRSWSNIAHKGSHCTKCSPPKTGYDKLKKGYIYLLGIQTLTETILGYGITNKLNKRITDHKRNLKSIGATITNIQVFEGSGTAVLAVENAIKALHPTGLIDCEGFRRESISFDRKEEVLELCKKLKELDNTNKLL